MKVTFKDKEVADVVVGDLIVGGSGTEYIVSKCDNGNFSLYCLRENRIVTDSHTSIKRMIDRYFNTYTHHSKERLELVVKAGVQ